MRYLLIDTCSWIDVAAHHRELLSTIADLVEGEQITLLVPEIVVREWERHSDRKILAKRLESFDGRIKNGQSLRNRLGGLLSEEERSTWERIHDRLQEERGQIEVSAQEDIQTVKRLFDDPRTIILPVTDHCKVQAADLALEKKPPFGSRNSMADAIIFLSAINYTAREEIDDFILVSANTGDFAQQNELHPELQELSDEVAVEYFANIGRAVNKIEEGRVSQESLEQIELSLAMQAFHDARERLAAATRPKIDLSAMERASEIQEMLDQAAGAMPDFSDIERVSGVQRALEEAARVSVDLSAIEALSESQKQLVEATQAKIDLSAMERASEIQEMLDQATGAMPDFSDIERVSGVQRALEEAARVSVDLSAIEALSESQKQLVEAAQAKIDLSAMERASEIQEMLDRATGAMPDFSDIERVSGIQRALEEAAHVSVDLSAIEALSESQKQLVEAAQAKIDLSAMERASEIQEMLDQAAGAMPDFSDIERVSGIQRALEEAAHVSVDLSAIEALSESQKQLARMARAKVDLSGIGASSGQEPAESLSQAGVPGDTALSEAPQDDNAIQTGKEATQEEGE